MAHQAFICNGTSNESCGCRPDEKGRFILGSRSARLWVLCEKHAGDYSMNIQISLNCGDTELNFVQAVAFCEGSAE